MYLVHVRLKGPGRTTGRTDLATIVTSCAGNADGLEHVTVHPGPCGDVTLGLFLLANDLAAAEQSAARVAGQAVSGHPALSEFRVLESQGALVPGPWWIG
ncbi:MULTISPECIES: hypothetical protein [Streptomyces]|uniref:YCII-related domain-containing protein n=1 Tax=Streptomyces thermoviolaceus subsp. thermoviolaceus TaxID=66860 RepID=A0ABX0YTG1_STRTL|nr:MULTISPECIES: hypothetical protein [Streptomyces]MCM3262907.1 hypothetical protein [Streptomyces thermoviolaceus]NJP15897.1 hypothetical protein [Streptomyces thermoviolaceus subsp. thermoviolaceus]RSS07823.1 hypothetical protein EF917_03900 [Streptomyces sp. WAC00469]WTD47611.1 hypothetical protein OG899_08815 [Streptomyces thermoviolaceus]GGV79692.1 hypothetical protein GCM10010499_41420 [Streptomyces thermoviolaceus subsp. apingens]